MIHLKEFQTKHIFKTNRIQIPKCLLLKKPSDLQSAKLDFENGWVVKAQVPFSSRFKKGLIVLQEPGSRLRSAVRQISDRMKEMHRSDEILIEEKSLGHSQEYYLAVISDASSRCPSILFGLQGGVNVESDCASQRRDIFRLSVDMVKGLQDYQLHEFFSKAGIQESSLMKGLIRTALTLYKIYREWNAHFVEVNPLVQTNGKMLALDGKMEIDEDAVFRMNSKMIRFIEHVEGRAESPLETKASKIDAWDYRGACHFVQTDTDIIRQKYAKSLKAYIGFNGVGTGVSLAAMDELVRKGFYPRNFCDTSGNPPASKLYRVTRIILNQDQIEGYFFISCISSQQLHHTARGIIKALKELYPKSGGYPPMPALLVFRGAWDAEAKDLFEEHGLKNNRSFHVCGREMTERTAAQKFSKLYENYYDC